MEFTDVFVTMARIAGIPAREVDGYAYTSDTANHPIYYPGLGSDILHAWAEIYLPGSGWVMVDPTWGSTTGGVDFFGRIDLNRIAFAVKGLSSTTPYAAGSYKTNDKQDGDVKVSFSDKPVNPQSGMQLKLSDNQVIAGIGSTVALQVTNSGNVALSHLDLNAKPGQPVSLSRVADVPDNLLPGQSATIWLPFRADGWLTSGHATLVAGMTAQDISNTKTTANQKYTLSIQPFFAAIIVPILILMAIIGAVLGGSWLGLHHWYHKSAPTVEPPVRARSSAPD
jgi:hypothetical protein